MLARAKNVSYFQSLHNEFISLKAHEGFEASKSSKANEIVVYLHEKASFCFPFRFIVGRFKVFVFKLLRLESL